MNKNTFLLFLSLLALITSARSQTAIGNSEQLAAINMNGSYYLTADLVVDHWSPVGVFTGTFDGRGHCITIKQCQADSNGYGGLFSSTNGAVISNLIVGGNFLSANTFGGGLVGVAINTTIDCCETEAVVRSDNENAFLGGLVGKMDGGMMLNSSSNATLEGAKMGGLAGMTTSGTNIKNCYSNTTFIYASDPDKYQVGFLVHTNGGLLENNYAKTSDNGWYIPSIGQLALLYSTQPIFYHVNHMMVSWTTGHSLSSSLTKPGYLLYIDEDGVIRQGGYRMFTLSNYFHNVRFVHDFHGVGHNIGDIIYVNGIRSFVFYINDAGDGGWVTACLDTVIRAEFTQSDNDATDGYYVDFNNYTNSEAIDYDYAQWHDGVTVKGDVVNVIPESYDHNPGRFFTTVLRENDNRTNTVVNAIKPAHGSSESNTLAKQLAYHNQGVIKQCFYPLATSAYGLTKTGGSTQCTRYSTSTTPYDYGQFGPFLYKNNTATDLAMVDSLNAWVKASGDERFVSWSVAGTSAINDNAPIHKYSFSDGTATVNTSIDFGKSMQNKALRYANVNLLTPEQKGFKTTLAYYGNDDEVQADNVTQPWSGSLYVTEDARLKGSYQLNANVCVTMDNSDASSFAGANYDWHFISTPLANAPVGIYYSIYTNGGPFGNPSQVKFNNENGYFPLNTPYAKWDFYCYDEPNDGWPNFKRRVNDHYHHDTGEPINYTNEANLIPGKGYLWAIGKKTGLQAYGKLNNGTVNRTVTNQGGIYSGYNLVGNPYHAALDFDIFAEQNSSMLAQNAYCILDADKQGYVSYCPGASDNPVYASRYLNPHQGFFIQVISNGTVAFNTNQAVVNAETHFRGETPAHPLVNLIVTDTKGSSDYATVELDRPVAGGALKMKGLHACEASLSISHAGEEYSIAFVEGHPKSVPVRCRALSDGSYTMHWDLRNADFGYLHLLDNLTGTDVDCLASESYVFAATTKDYPSRFKLLFAPLSVEEDEGQGLPVAYLSNQTIVVEGPGQVTLFDLQGRQLKSCAGTGDIARIPVQDLASGVYLLRLTHQQQTNVQKIIIP